MKRAASPEGAAFVLPADESHTSLQLYEYPFSTRPKGTAVLKLVWLTTGKRASTAEASSKAIAWMMRVLSPDQRRLLAEALMTDLSGVTKSAGGFSEPGGDL